MNKAQKADLITKVKFMMFVGVFIASGLQLSEASDKTETSNKKTPHEICKAISSTAQLIMENRQSGVPMHSMMEVSENPIFRNYVMSAFERPKYNTSDYKIRAASEFRDQAYLECMKTVTDR